MKSLKFAIFFDKQTLKSQSNNFDRPNIKIFHPQEIFEFYPIFNYSILILGLNELQSFFAKIKQSTCIKLVLIDTLKDNFVQSIFEAVKNFKNCKQLIINLRFCNANQTDLYRKIVDVFQQQNFDLTIKLNHTNTNKMTVFQNNIFLKLYPFQKKLNEDQCVEIEKHSLFDKKERNLQTLKIIKNNQEEKLLELIHSNEIKKLSINYNYQEDKILEILSHQQSITSLKLNQKQLSYKLFETNFSSLQSLTLYLGKYSGASAELLNAISKNQQLKYLVLKILEFEANASKDYSPKNQALLPANLLECSIDVGQALNKISFRNCFKLQYLNLHLTENFVEKKIPKLHDFTNLEAIQLSFNFSVKKNSLGILQDLLGKLIKSDKFKSLELQMQKNKIFLMKRQLHENSSDIDDLAFLQFLYEIGKSLKLFKLSIQGFTHQVNYFEVLHYTKEFLNEIRKDQFVKLNFRVRGELPQEWKLIPSLYSGMSQNIDFQAKFSINQQFYSSSQSKVQTENTKRMVQSSKILYSDYSLEVSQQFKKASTIIMNPKLYQSIFEKYSNQFVNFQDLQL